MTWVPHITVAAVIEKNEQFLIIEENTSEGIRFNQPAGHLEPNETIINAVIRETQEEAARLIEPQHLIGIYRWYCEYNKHTYLRFCFYAKEISFDPVQKLDNGIIRTLWMTQNELIEQQNKCRSPLVLQCISDYIAGKQYPMSLLQDELFK